MTRRAGQAACICVLAATAALYLHAIGSTPLLEPDEGKYAEIAREMVASGDWVVPRRDGFVYVQKPPLGYWLTALAYRALGTDAAAARLAPAVAAIATVGTTIWLGTRWFGVATGLAAGAMLATAPLFYVFGRLAILDMELTLFVTLAIGFLLRAAEDGRRRWRLAAGAAMGAAFLVKGLVGIVIPTGVVLLAAVVERDRRLVTRTLTLATWLPAILVPLPWLGAVAARVDGFAEFFFVRQHLVRYAVGGKIGHHQPPWALTAALLAGALPWSLVLVRAMAADAAGMWRDPGRRAERCLALWLVVVVGFFSASRAAIVTYVCPALVPLALLAARAWTQGRPGRVPGVWAAAVVLVLGITLVRADRFDALLDVLLRPRWWDAARALRAHVGVSAAVILAGLLAARVMRSRGAQLGVLVATLAVALVWTEPARAVFRSYAQLGGVIRARGAESDRVVVYGRLLDGLPFYARRRTAVVAWNGMDDFGGGRRDGHALRWSERRLVRSWDGHRRLFLVIAPDAWRQLRPKLGRPATVIAAEHDRVLLTNAPLGERPTGGSGRRSFPSRRVS